MFKSISGFVVFCVENVEFLACRVSVLDCYLLSCLVFGCHNTCVDSLPFSCQALVAEKLLDSVNLIKLIKCGSIDTADVPVDDDHYADWRVWFDLVPLVGLGMSRRKVRLRNAAGYLFLLSCKTCDESPRLYTQRIRTLSRVFNVY